MIKLNVVRIRLCKNHDQVNKSSNGEQAKCEQVQNTKTGFSFVKLMCTNATQEQAKEERNPLVALFFSATANANVVDILVLISVIDDNIGLGELLHLFSTFRTDDAFFIDQLSAMLTELLVFGHLVSFLLYKYTSFYHGYAVFFIF